MPRLDEHHEAVKNALIKEGWTITDDPFTIDFEDATLFADLAAERTIAAQKDNEKIVIEIKMFGSRSAYDDLEKAFGQYQVYRSFLRQIEPSRQIFLAVSVEKQAKIFSRESVKFLVGDLQIKLVIFNPETEEIVEWIK
ncbi:MAG TPA: element excision factor XisH family protein [Pyrinomonadaceae bacterium]|nr:element excision factor XisH family protein [Pyrinomonadaceae bacterium]